MTRPETEIEMERGRIIAGRAKRGGDLRRLVAGKKVKIMNYGLVNLFYVDGVFLGHENTDNADYPSEPLMATIMLAVAATVGLEGVPDAQTIDPEVRRRRDEYRKFLPNGSAAIA